MSQTTNETNISRCIESVQKIETVALTILNKVETTLTTTDAPTVSSAELSILMQSIQAARKTLQESNLDALMPSTTLSESSSSDPKSTIKACSLQELLSQISIEKSQYENYHASVSAAIQATRAHNQRYQQQS